MDQELIYEDVNDLVEESITKELEILKSKFQLWIIKYFNLSA